MIRRSNTEALQYKRQIECNRITNDNQNINKTNEKHVKNYRSSRTPEDGRSLRSSITLWAEQLNIRFLLYESLLFELNSLTYTFCSTSHYSLSWTAEHTLSALRVISSWSSITLRAELLLDESRKAGGKPSTWFPPGGIVEQSTGEEDKKNAQAKNLI